MINPTIIISTTNFPYTNLFTLNKPTSQLIHSKHYTNVKNININIKKEFIMSCKHIKTDQKSNQHNVINLHAGLCTCGRRHFVNVFSTTLFTSLSLPSFALETDSLEMLNKYHPPGPDWYEEFYASALNNVMGSYEAEIAGYKSQLFSELRGKAKEVLEIGIGTGPNLKYYASDPDMHVFGVDPNRKMEKYARQAAEAAGLSPQNFKFVHAVGEGLPLRDASVDAVVGTLVMCSVKDVNRTLDEIKRVLKPGGLYLFIDHVAAKDGTSLRFLQNILSPLQKLVADGCHLTRETGRSIAEAGFSNVNSSTAVISNAFFINPHVYGIARK